MQKILITSILSTCGILTGCTSPPHGTLDTDVDAQEKFDRTLPYVCAVDMPETINQGEELEITIHGSFPDQSWTFHQIEYKVAMDEQEILKNLLLDLAPRKIAQKERYQQKGNQIDISVWGKKIDSTPAVATMLTDFTQTVRIPDLTSGRYNVIVHGSDQIIIRDIYVSSVDKEKISPE